MSDLKARRAREKQQQIEWVAAEELRQEYWSARHQYEKPPALTSEPCGRCEQLVDSLRTLGLDIRYHLRYIDSTRIN